MASSTSKKKSNAMKPAPKLDHYLLQISLQPLTIPQYQKKRINRTIRVPASATFSQLHVGIFTAYQWDDSHSWEFAIHDCIKWNKTNAAKKDGCLLKILLNPYRLRLGGPPERVAKKLCLEEIFEDERYKGKVVEYTWDGWSHVVVVKKMVEGRGCMEYVKGEWKPPAEHAPFPVYALSARDEEDIGRELSEVKCGVGEEGNPDEEGSSDEEDNEEGEDGDESGAGEHGEDGEEPEGTASEAEEENGPDSSSPRSGGTENSEDEDQIHEGEDELTNEPPEQNDEEKEAGSKVFASSGDKKRGIRGTQAPSDRSVKRVRTSSS